MPPMRYAAGKTVRKLLTDSDNDPVHPMQRVPRVAVARRGLCLIIRVVVSGRVELMPWGMLLFVPHCFLPTAMLPLCRNSQNEMSLHSK